MSITSALSNASSWLLKRDAPEPDMVATGIALMSVFKEHGERKDALVAKMKAAADRRDRHAMEAVAAEAERVEFEGQFVAEDKAQRASYDEVVKYIAALAPLPSIVTDAATAALAEQAAQEAGEAAGRASDAPAPAETLIAVETASEAEPEPASDAGPDLHPNSM